MFNNRAKRRAIKVIAKSDRAYDQAAYKAKELATEVSATLARQFADGDIDEQEIHNLVARLLEHAATAPGVTLPMFALKSVLQVLRDEIYLQLQHHGVNLAQNGIKK